MSDILDAALDAIPADEIRLFDLCDEVAGRIADALTARNWTQRDLATALGKRESYVSRVLAGGANLTLKTIAQFEVALETALIRTDDTAALNEDVAPYYGPTILDWPTVTLRIATAVPMSPHSQRRSSRQILTGAHGRPTRMQPARPAPPRTQTDLPIAA